MEIVLFLTGLACGFGAAAFLLTRRGREAVDREREHAQQRVADLERATAERIRLLEGSRAEREREMKALLADIVPRATEQLARLNEAQLGKGTEAIKSALEPVAGHLKRVEEQVVQLDRERRQSQGGVAAMLKGVTEEIGRLRSETGTLVNALRRPQVRGAWGEMQLRNCVEAANMVPHVDFHDQRTYDDGEGGRQRPDMTVHLPAGRSVVVDAKVPLDAYLAALDAKEDSDARDLELDRHARQLRSHVDTLASKTYHARLDVSPEFVICFVPNEAVYCAALDRDASLLEHGTSRGVLIATPTTLIALLHAVYYGWRQERIAESAREIADAARELHKRMATFLEPFAKVGRQLDSATNAYNSAVGSLESRVLPQLRRIEEAGAKSEKDLPQPVPLDTAPRLVTAPERHAPAEPDELPPALSA